MIPSVLLSLVEGWLGPKFAKFAKPLIYVGFALLIVILIFVAVKIHDHRVISAHDANQRAVTTEADKKADNHAADQRRTDDARLTNESTELQRSTNNAQTDLDRRLAFQRCLRLQQSARAAKRQPPACS